MIIDKKFLRISISVILLSSLSAVGFSSDERFFADYLFDQGYYEEAAGEYLRLKFQSDDFDRWIALGDSLKKTGRYREALGCYQREGSAKALRKAAVICLILEAPEEYRKMIERQVFTSEEQRLFQVAGEIYFDGKQAEITFPEDNETLDRRWKELQMLDQRIRKKLLIHPLAAGAASALIPGSGKLILGRWQDALMSFGLSFSFAGLTAFQIKEDRLLTLETGVAAGLFFIFYTGNCFGSYRAAENAAQNFKAEYRREVIRILENY